MTVIVSARGDGGLVVGSAVEVGSVIFRVKILENGSNVRRRKERRRG